jgi:hypothetical protein
MPSRRSDEVSPQAVGCVVVPERFPSGQREQAVNLPAYAFEGSNPSLSTKPA